MKSPWKTMPTWGRDSNGLLYLMVGKHISFPTVEQARALAAELIAYADTMDAEITELSS
jgi:hypothetical protein